MFKSVLIIIIVIVMLIIARTVLQRLKKPAKKSSINSKDTVQCLQCKTYIAHDEAIFKGDKAFCSRQHLNDWNHSS